MTHRSQRSMFWFSVALVLLYQYPRSPSSNHSVRRLLGWSCGNNRGKFSVAGILKTERVYRANEAEEVVRQGQELSLIMMMSD